MRLLNATTLKLEEFWDNNATPPYAILSHTWEQQEVSFIAISSIESASRLAGFSKIEACCRQALADGYKWVWVDTCCIDKSSSAELSEAINSMFRWYKEAAVCYAYLADVPPDDELHGSESAFSNSRWFRRGWTLQELIAPKEVVFFSREWTRLGYRSQFYFLMTLSEITKIDIDVLQNSSHMLKRSIARRMSWASRRETTRREDIAYCLMGLFDVNMPLLYGEGTKAFIRLQEEIIKRSYDDSLFAWTAPKPDGIQMGFLAASPSYFQHSNDYVFRNNMPTVVLHLKKEAYSMTNMGLCINVPLCHVPGTRNAFIAVLMCGTASAWNSSVGLPVFVHNQKTLTQPGSLENFKYFAAPSIARRDSHGRLVALTITNFGDENPVPWVEIKLDADTREMKTYVSKLYVPQETIYNE